MINHLLKRNVFKRNFKWDLLSLSKVFAVGSLFQIVRAK